MKDKQFLKDRWKTEQGQDFRNQITSNLYRGMEGHCYIKEYVEKNQKSEFFDYTPDEKKHFEQYIDMRYIRLVGGIPMNAFMRNYDFTGALLQSPVFAYTHIENVIFNETDFRNAKFFYSSLKNLSFNDVSLRGATFSHCELENVSIKNSNLQTIELKYVSGEKVELVNSDSRALLSQFCDLEISLKLSANLSKSYFENCHLKLSNDFNDIQMCNIAMISSKLGLSLENGLIDFSKAFLENTELYSENALNPKMKFLNATLKSVTFTNLPIEEIDSSESEFL